MFALTDKSGDWARMRNGARFVFSERRLARMAAQHLFKYRGHLEVVDA